MNSKASSAPASSGSKFLVFLLLAAVAGLGAWAFILKQDLAGANEELASARKSSNGATVAQGELQRLKAKVNELEARLAAVPVATPVAAPKAAAPAPANPAAAMGSLASQMLSNPAMRSMVAAQMKRTFETRYADLFAKFGFDQDQRDRFIGILTENQDAMIDLSQKMTAGNLSPADREEIQRQGKEMDAAIEGRMREFFNDENKYAEYKLFTEQQTERTQVTALQTSLSRSNPLTAEQSAALTDIMYEERKAAAATNRNTPADSADPAVALSANAVDIQVRRQEQLQNRVAERAASVLNPDQMAALRSTQANQLTTLRLGADMARSMFGAGQPAAK